jgi:predicted RecB family nuclease
MREDRGVRLYSATDLVNFLGCGHATALDLRQLAAPTELPPADDHAVLLQEKGLEHEKAYLASLRAQGLQVVEIEAGASLRDRVERTRAAMAAGAEAIYQGALFNSPWHGYADFLLRTDETPSALGRFAYEVADTKLSRSAKPKHVLQLCVYAELLEDAQGCPPPAMHIVLGDGAQVSLRTTDFRHYYAVARRRFEAFVADPDGETFPEPCGHCAFCRWRERCEGEWDASEHLSLVAGITRSQMTKLRGAGVDSMRTLAQFPLPVRIPNLQSETFARLRAQAALQVGQRDTGEGRCELLPLEAGRGFARLPQPDPGDLFFDMEGDPHYDGGLEYLFGLVHQVGDEWRFSAFWAHDRSQERRAFEQAVDFIVARLAQHPAAHIYHYAAYEQTALKRLAMYHGSRETEVDELLRRRKLVDLYKVVREGVRISEPTYSLKNLEAFYIGSHRVGDVKSAGDSIVMYERWRRLEDAALLGGIATYNELDCRSTLACRDWLLRLRPSEASWFAGAAPSEAKPEREKNRREAEARTAALFEVLTSSAPPHDRGWRELLGHLLEFHRREAKPSWWATFARQEMSEEELIDDSECIGGLRPDPSKAPYPDKRSTVYSFTFPAQDFKMRLGDTPVRAGTLEPVGEIVALDEQSREISLRLGPTRTPLGGSPSLIPEGPIGDKVLREAIHRYAEAVAAGKEADYAAVTDVLTRAAPRVHGLTPGAPVISEGVDVLDGAIDALARLDRSYMLVQGPPGAGKTFTSSHAVVALLAAGKKVAVASNSHKAINNLLAAVEAVARERAIGFRGVKKSTTEEQYLNGGGLIEDTTDNARATPGAFDLVAGTAWLFARPELDRAFDYLFVDEAGQVSLANIVAMGVSAENIVLVGDQMQLAQPIQGVHPGGSGVSALEHLLGEMATVPPARGVFLPITRRMHPDVCQFISQAVYDGRLEADDGARRQRLVLREPADAEALAPTGLRFVAVDHAGCAQKSAEEAERLKRAYRTLVGQRWIDREGAERVVSSDDILVVSPYNMQVNLLRSVLPAGARVGTVDKFQGQEAAVVLISMATSSGEDLPRQIEFLYSRNRLNVAISRARCLAVVFANPKLLEIACATVEQMRLVNTLCWVEQYALAQARAAA